MANECLDFLEFDAVNTRWFCISFITFCSNFIYIIWLWSIYLQVKTSFSKPNHVKDEKPGEARDKRPERRIDKLTQCAVSVHASGQPVQGSKECIVSLYTTTISTKQLHQVSEVVAEILLKKRPQPNLNSIESLRPTETVKEHCTCTEPEIFHDKHFPQTKSYNTDFGLSVSNRLKMKIISGYYINFSLLIENPYEVDPHDVTKVFFQ